MNIKFLRCNHCGNKVEMIYDSGVTPMCCGEPMQQIMPNTVDAAQEKHVPVIEIAGNKVTVSVGSVEHPMIVEHYIEWIVLHTQKGVQRKHLTPNDKPVAVFYIGEDDSVIEAYEYCNLHGLWKKEI